MAWESIAVDQIYTSLGVSATYTPNGGAASTVTAIVRRPDEVVGVGETQIWTESILFEVRTSEIATPQPEDTIAYDGTTYVIDGEPTREDPSRLTWTLNMRSQ